uniref:glucosaminidase domain-containing protein n=1 Tax=Flavobacterium sp. TaxID=239 RepID=UPI004048FC07
MQFKKITLLLFLVVLAISCGTKKSVVPVNAKQKTVITKKPITSVSSKHPIEIKKIEKPNNSNPTEKIEKKEELEELEATSKISITKDNVQLYIDDFHEIAKSNMKEHGIPASITLAQGVLESGAGKGRLSTIANNHFGIKCHKGWTGESVRHDDDASQECFRKYNDPAESYKDHSLFLTSRPWYNPLFKLDKGDYVAWAKGLKASGYATDPKYPEKLISIIERYELHKYDEEVLNRTTSPKTKMIVANKEETYTIQQGDTLYSLSKKLNLTVEEIKKMNDMSDNNLSIGQKIKIK